MFSRISKSLPVSFVVAFLLSASPLLAQAPAIEVHFNWRTEKEHCRDYRAAVSEARDPCLPDTNRTPGKVRPGWTLEMTEAKGGTQQYRDVPVKLKREVWHNYGYDTTVGSYDAHHKDYEFDHLIPNCLGGASVKENIWPQPLTGPWNARDKDRLEHHVRLQVLHHKITLEQAQGMFTANWIETYKGQFGAKPDAPTPDSPHDAPTPRRAGSLTTARPAVIRTGILPTLAAGRSRHGKIAADGTCQGFLDLVVSGNSFLAAGLRVAPDRVAAAIAD